MAYTQGELKALLAPVFSLASEDIEEFIIVVQGKCYDCGSPGALYTASSADNPHEDAQLLRDTIRSFTEGHD